MGWSESYYADMKKEAGEELRKRSSPLLEALAEFRDTVTAYRDFIGNVEELEVLLERLEGILYRYGVH